MDWAERARSRENAINPARNIWDLKRQETALNILSDIEEFEADIKEKARKTGYSKGAKQFQNKTWVIKVGEAIKLLGKEHKAELDQKEKELEKIKKKKQKLKLSLIWKRRII